MIKKSNLNKYSIPHQLDSIEQKIFVGSIIYELYNLKGSKPLSIFGIDLISRKICPNPEMMFSIISEILQKDFSNDDLYSSEFIVPIKLAKELASDEFKKEVLKNSDELINIWTEISIYEAIEYVNQLLIKINSKQVCLEKAWPVIARLNQHFSAGQLWNLSYKANQRACEIILTKKINEENYPDILIESILEKGLFYVDRGLTLLPFKRWGKLCRQSEFSRYFFETILEIGEDGFTNKPSTTFIKQSEG